MALGDYVSKVLVQFKGDTSDLKGKIKDLQGEERKLAKETLDRVNAQNAALEKHVAAIGKVAIAVGGAVGAYKLLSDGLDHYVKRQRLQAQATGIDLAALSKAAAGTKTQMELLQFAAKTTSGTFKLTQAQMQTVLGAMRSLERKGYDSAEVFDRLTTAVTEAKGDALEPFGIVLETTGTKAERVQQILAALSGEAANVKDSAIDAGEQYKQLSVEFQDAMGQLKDSLGELAIALRPVIKLVAEAVAGFSEFLRAVGSNWDHSINKNIAASDTPLGEQLRMTMDSLGVDASEAMAIHDLQSNMAIEGTRAAIMKSNPRAFLRASRDPYKVAGDDMAEARSKLESDVRAAVSKSGWDEAYKMAVASGPGTLAIFNQVAGPRPAPKVKRAGGGRGAGAPSGDRVAAFSGGAVDLGEMGDFSNKAPTATGGIGAQGLDIAAPVERATYALEGFQERYEALEFGEGRTMLEQIFGPIESFDAYANAWGALNNTLQAGFAAWVDGGKSVGQAMKEALKTSLASVAADMFARAIQHGAMAIGSLAMGDFRGAATHGAAAAKFGAGAIAVGLIARKIGGSGGGESAGAYGGGAGAGAAAQSLPTWSPAQNVNRSVTLVIGDDFAEDSPRKRAQKAGRYLNMGLRQVGASGVAFA